VCLLCSYLGSAYGNYVICIGHVLVSLLHIIPPGSVAIFLVAHSSTRLKCSYKVHILVPPLVRGIFPVYVLKHNLLPSISKGYSH